MGSTGSNVDPQALAAVLGSGPAPAVVSAAPAKRPVRISGGVTQGLLLSPIRPAYPAIARAAHVEGTVVLAAVIDRSGRLVDLNVLSGPQMLRNAALEAVATARFRPYLLNGEPTEVATTLSVVFTFAGGS